MNNVRILNESKFSGDLIIFRNYYELSMKILYSQSYDVSDYTYNASYKEVDKF